VASVLVVPSEDCGTEVSGVGFSVALVLGMGRIVAAVVDSDVLAVVFSFPRRPQAHRQSVRTSTNAINANFFIISLLFLCCSASISIISGFRLEIVRKINGNIPCGSK
jgi:hypothetical protein